MALLENMLKMHHFVGFTLFTPIKKIGAPI